jgi:hypothetical protein
MLRIITKKFGGKKFKRNFKGNGRSRITRNTRVLTKARTLSRNLLIMTTLKFVRVWLSQSPN